MIWWIVGGAIVGAIAGTIAFGPKATIFIISTANYATIKQYAQKAAEKAGSTWDILHPFTSANLRLIGFNRKTINLANYIQQVDDAQPRIETINGQKYKVWYTHYIRPAFKKDPNKTTFFIYKAVFDNPYVGMSIENINPKDLQKAANYLKTRPEIAGIIIADGDAPFPSDEDILNAMKVKGMLRDKEIKKVILQKEPLPKSKPHPQPQPEPEPHSQLQPEPEPNIEIPDISYYPYYSVDTAQEPKTAEAEKNNTMLYIALGIGAFLFLLKK